MKNCKISYLTDAITPDVSGILWLTDGPLSTNSMGAYEFNYLLDGNLFDYIHTTQNQKTSNFHMASNFSRPFFIAHSVIETQFNFKSIEENFKLIESMATNNSFIYLFNDSKNTANINLENELQKKYQTYQFKHLFL